MEFGLLGPLLVSRGEMIVPIPPGNQRVLLAVLLLNANRVVSVDTLTEIIWPVRPPPSARSTLHNYVKRLRHALGDAGHQRIRTQPLGYLIRVEPGELDVARFEILRDDARAAARAGSWHRAAHQFHAALRLWRGEPLMDVRSDPLAASEAPRLAEMRLQALEERIEADLQLGRDGDVIAELQQVIAAHPLRERFHWLLLLALYRCGRQGDALASYQRARRLLNDELGIEPGSQLRQLQNQILTADPALGSQQHRRPVADEAVTHEPGGYEPAAHARPAGQQAARERGVHVPGPAVPRQLPAPVPHFACRVRELRELSEILDRCGLAQRSAVITAIWGTAGVGKSALAIRWAHQVSDYFPDGQLYVNLRGFGPYRLAVPPDQAVGWLLDGLAVPSQRIPAGLEARAALYRSLLADRSMLIVLDNARDAEQIRPLLPGSPGCLVVITSRTELTGLVTTCGAHPVVVDLLTPHDSHELLAMRLGADQLEREPPAAAELIELCAGLPLALSVVAARSCARPSLSLACLATELRGALSPLDALETGDPASNVRAVFSWSSQKLSRPAARLFRLLGMHCGPDITSPAAASLAGLPSRQARRLLGELARASLLTEHLPGRFACHDLLRAFAAEQGRTRDCAADRHGAVNRALDHYLHTARAAAMLLYPGRDPITLDPPAPGTSPEALDGHGQALAWCQAERQVLLAAITQAATLGFDRHAWQIPWTLSAFFDFQGHWDDWAASQHIALEAATRLGDWKAQARAYRSTGDALARLGRHAEARERLARALDLYRDLGDTAGQARVLSDTAWVCELQGRPTDALSYARQAFGTYRATGHRPGQARTLNLIGWYHVLCGDQPRAISHSRQALALNREVGNRHGEAESLDSLGCAHSKLGQHAEAAACFDQALELRRACGDQVGEAETLEHLGDARHAACDLHAARAAWSDALKLLDSFRDRRADQVRAKLLRLTTRGGFDHPNRNAPGDTQRVGLSGTHQRYRHVRSRHGGWDPDHGRLGPGSSCCYRAQAKLLASVVLPWPL
jgi:DNA-binding SARP family transcriptional activator